MSTALVVLDQRPPRGVAHDRALPARRASVHVRKVRARHKDPRCHEEFIVRLCAIALVVVIYRYRGHDLRHHPVTTMVIPSSWEPPNDAHFTCVGTRSGLRIFLCCMNAFSTVREWVVHEVRTC